MIGFVLLGALTLGAPFRDGAVLQRGMLVRIENLRRFHAKWMKPNHSEYRGDFAGKEIVLFSPEVPEPKSVRYLFSRPWRGTVYNEARLPLGAFHIEVR